MEQPVLIYLDKGVVEVSHKTGMEAWLLNIKILPIIYS